MTSPDFTLVPGVHGLLGPALECRGELLRVSEGAQHSGGAGGAHFLQDPIVMAKN